MISSYCFVVPIRLTLIEWQLHQHYHCSALKQISSWPCWLIKACLSSVVVLRCIFHQECSLITLGLVRSYQLISVFKEDVKTGQEEPYFIRI